MRLLDPSSSALYALVVVCLVALGVIVSGDTQQFSIAERGTVLGGIVAVLAGVALFARKKDGE